MNGSAQRCQSTVRAWRALRWPIVDVPAWSVSLLAALAILGLGGCEDQRTPTRTPTNVLYVNGQPLMPTGVYFWPDISKPTGRNPFEDIAAYGFDTLVAYYEYVRPDRTVQNQPDIHELRRECDRLGINYFIDAPRRADLADKSDEQLEALFAATTDAVSDSPHFVGWMFDEPVWNGIDLDLMRRAATAVRAHPARPLVWINFAPVDQRWDTPGWPDMQAYANIGDIVGFDFYPVETGLPWEGYISKSRIEDFAWFVDVMRNWVGSSKPIWMIQQGYRPGDLESPPTDDGRRPNRTETRFMSFDALVHGATGIFYFSGSLLRDAIPADDPTWDVYIRETAAALRGLRDAVVSTEPPETVSVSSSEVRTLARRHHGRTVLVAVRETAGEATDVTIALGKTLTGQLVVEGENRSVAILDGSFSDRFEPYAVHIYRSQ